MFKSPFHVPGDQLAKLAKPHTRGCARSLEELRLLLKGDLQRYEGTGSLKWLKLFLFNAGYKYIALVRIVGYLKVNGLAKYTLYPPFKLLLLHYRHLFGMAIAEYADIGPGLFVTRFGGIYVNGDCLLGANVNLSPMILFGQTNRGKIIGSPVVGNRVFIASGARVTGPITIGDDVAIGANAVVNKSAEDGAVLVGVPARIVSHDGSQGYINRQASQELIAACARARRRHGGPDAIWYPADMLDNHGGTGHA
ncbi:hexapeptide transferase [Sphingomonas sp.]|uniref:serine O-acetyltransferase n=1 Tax=Sphingomonas sp. TaxID=28214 RepID=UPI002ED9F49C